MATHCTSYFYETDDERSQALAVTKLDDRAHTPEHPHGLMSCKQLEHQSQSSCQKLVDKAKLWGIPHIEGFQANRNRSITATCGLKLKGLDKDGKAQFVHLLVQQ